MSFANIAFCVLIGTSGLLFAETDSYQGASFKQTVSAPLAPGDTAAKQMELMADLKRQVIVDWLQKYMGAKRAASLEKQLNGEVIDRYIPIFGKKVVKNPDGTSKLEVEVELDTVGLGKWTREMDAVSPTASSTIKPVLIVSSTVPGVAIMPTDPPARFKDSLVIRTILSTLQGMLQKYHARLVHFDQKSLMLNVPPRTNREVAQLRDDVDGKEFNSAIWVYLARCSGCKPISMNTYVYNLAQDRLVLARSEELDIDPKDLIQGTKFKTVLDNSLKGLRAEFDDKVSSGALLGRIFRVVVSGLKDLGAFPWVQQEIAGLPFCAQAPKPVRAHGNEVEFEVVSQRGEDEIEAQLRSSGLSRPGIKVRVRAL